MKFLENNIFRRYFQTRILINFFNYNNRLLFLFTFYYSFSDDEISFTVPSKRQYCPSEQFSRDDPEVQDEHRKILETIENALKQLNIVCKLLLNEI